MRVRRVVPALAGLVAAAAVALVAHASPSLPMPTIVSGPPASTPSTRATLVFRDARAGVTFECALDAAAFRACSSPRAYAGLAQGGHRFRVRARAADGTTSAAAARTWSVDRTPPPAPAITDRPAALSRLTSATFRFTDAERGVRFRCALDAAASTPCTSPAVFAGPLAQGAHRFRVVARDAAGNTSAPASASWRVDSRPPAPPVLTAHPANPTTDRAARFAFADAEAGVTFECRLDGGAYAVCRSPLAYASLASGRHTFAVRALDAAGNASAPLTYTWTILASTFPVTGDVDRALVPGAAPAPLDVRITNPYSSALAVTALQVAVGAGTTRDGRPNPACDGPTNLRVVAQYAGVLPLVVPAGRTLALSELGVPAAQWPQVQMPNLPVNQDACKGTRFALVFSAAGSAG